MHGTAYSNFSLYNFTKILIHPLLYDTQKHNIYIVAMATVMAAMCQVVVGWP